MQSSNIPGFIGAVNSDTPPSTYMFQWDEDPCSPRYVFSWFNNPPPVWNQGPVTSSNTSREWGKHRLQLKWMLCCVLWWFLKSACYCQLWVVNLHIYQVGGCQPDSGSFGRGHDKRLRIYGNWGLPFYPVLLKLVKDLWQQHCNHTSFCKNGSALAAKLVSRHFSMPFPLSSNAVASLVNHCPNSLHSFNTSEISVLQRWPGWVISWEEVRKSTATEPKCGIMKHLEKSPVCYKLQEQLRWHGGAEQHGGLIGWLHGGNMQQIFVSQMIDNLQIN